MKGAEARGHRTPDGFVVLQGSTAVSLALSDGFYKFTRDAEFSSPSTAAAVIEGGHANGLTDWKTKDGRILKELDEQA